MIEVKHADQSCLQCRTPGQTKENLGVTFMRDNARMLGRGLGEGKGRRGQRQQDLLLTNMLQQKEQLIDYR